MSALIKLDNIRKSYHNGDLSVEVLHGISLEIDSGEFVAIIGASGSGKSTLMNILGCLDNPTSGHYLLDGDSVADLDPDELAGLRRRTFGFIFQNYNLIPTASAQENVEIPAIYAGMSFHERQKRSEDLLTALNLADRLDHRPNQLSGGQQQRVSIARALMNGGRIILADEPTGALDSKSGDDVMALLRSMHAQGHTIIVITHSREVAEQANRLIEIKDGQIISDTCKNNIAPTSQTNAQPAVFAKCDKKSLISFSDLHESIKMAFRALKTNMFRTFLTLLGIFIGVSSVVALLAIGEGAQKSILAQINTMGSNLLLIRPGMANFRGSGNIATLIPEDATAIEELPNVRFAVPETSSSATLRYGNVDYQSSVIGTVPSYTISRSWKMQQGDFINQHDLNTYAPVIVLGATVANTLFPHGENPVGQYILVQKIPFQVIGVLAKKGAGFGGNDQDDVAIVPLTTGNQRLFGQRYVRNITVQVKNDALIDTTQAQIQALLNERHRREDTMITNMSSIRATVTQTTNSLRIFLGSIAAISLLVGGIGIMNIMLVSVTERTREIGVRMATGARRSDILMQFITEALVVSAIGGLCGIIFGLSVAGVAEFMGLPIQYSLSPLILAFSSAFATGLIFGYLPARKASKLLPAVALSSE